MPSSHSNNRSKPVIVLFREDLRLHDNQALSAACETGKPIITVFILDDDSAATQHRGAAWRWWLHHSLAALCGAISERGGALILKRGPHGDIVDALIRETGADAVHWNRRYHPTAIDCDTALKQALRERGIEAQSHGGHLLHEPSLLKTGSGTAYRVFTPFWNALQTLDDFGTPLPVPKKPTFANDAPKGERLEDWGLLPTAPDWAEPIADAWTPGEAAAHKMLDDFAGSALNGYAEGRDIPSLPATSRLSPYLSHGEISPRTIWHRIRNASGDVTAFLRELAWREFSYHLLFDNPRLADRNVDEKFDAFEWRSDGEALSAWQKGRTGIPIVDAGMQELWQTGWMHNRVRMICASFLIKHLMIDWREGERWFADTLVDADPANNAASWQWVAGTSPHSAPFFRIFNPVLQSRKFDPKGRYVRRYVPELEKLDDKALHEPASAPDGALDEVGLAADSPYRSPLVDLAGARDRALAAFKAL